MSAEPEAASDGLIRGGARLDATNIANAANSRAFFGQRVPHYQLALDLLFHHKWWRRGESNPRPKSAATRSLHA